MAIHTVVAVAPVAAFIANLNPILTAMASLLAIVWFGVLLHDRFIKKDK